MSLRPSKPWIPPGVSHDSKIEYLESSLSNILLNRWKFSPQLISSPAKSLFSMPFSRSKRVDVYGDMNKTRARLYEERMMDHYKKQKEKLEAENIKLYKIANKRYEAITPFDKFRKIQFIWRKNRLEKHHFDTLNGFVETADHKNAERRFLNDLNEIYHSYPFVENQDESIDCENVQSDDFVSSNSPECDLFEHGTPVHHPHRHHLHHHHHRHPHHHHHHPHHHHRHLDYDDYSHDKKKEKEEKGENDKKKVEKIQRIVNEVYDEREDKKLKKRKQKERDMKEKEICEKDNINNNDQGISTVSPLHMSTNVPVPLPAFLYTPTYSYSYCLPSPLDCSHPSFHHSSSSSSSSDFHPATQCLVPYAESVPTVLDSNSHPSLSSSMATSPSASSQIPPYIPPSSSTYLYLPSSPSSPSFSHSSSSFSASVLPQVDRSLQTGGCRHRGIHHTQHHNHKPHPLAISTCTHSPPSLSSPISPTSTATTSVSKNSSHSLLSSSYTTTSPSSSSSSLRLSTSLLSFPPPYAYPVSSSPCYVLPPKIPSP